MKSNVPFALIAAAALAALAFQSSDAQQAPHPGTQAGRYQLVDKGKDSAVFDTATGQLYAHEDWRVIVVDPVQARLTVRPVFWVQERGIAGKINRFNKEAVTKALLGYLKQGDPAGIAALTWPETLMEAEDGKAWCEALAEKAKAWETTEDLREHLELKRSEGLYWLKGEKRKKKKEKEKEESPR